MRKLIPVLVVILMLCGTALADMDVYYLDVGQADAAVVVCDNEVMMIDGGNPKDSQFIYSFLKNTLGIDSIDIVVATHPHDDHIGGLPAALNAVDAGLILSPVSEYDSKRFSSLLKYAPQGVTVPNVDDTYHLGDAVITILDPAAAFGDINDWSIVLRIDYGSTSFLFTGDASADAEWDMLSRGADLDCDVLKVGHHGSESSSSAAFLKAAAPDYAVISVGLVNSFGHPSVNTIDRLTAVGASIYRTDMNGTIRCHSNGRTLSFQTEKSVKSEQHSDAAVTSDKEVHDDTFEVRYVGNNNSHKFHYPDCQSVIQMKEKNKCFFSSRDEAISQGFTPCKNCNP